MTPVGAECLLRNLCGFPDLVPDLWSTTEPIDKPFDLNQLDSIVSESLVPSCGARAFTARTLAFFVRQRSPRYLISIDLRLGPVQWTTAHNHIAINIDEPWAEGEHRLADYLLSSVCPEFADYSRVVDTSKEDPDRLKEFRKALSPSEFLHSISQWKVTAPFGPYGLLEDIYWFNYFGPVYVDFIGLDRLLACDWARTDRIGGGLACYSSAAIDSSSAHSQRARIAAQLEEYVWTPGCRAEDKRVPTFDFSEQFAAMRLRSE